MFTWGKSILCNELSYLSVYELGRMILRIFPVFLSTDWLENCSILFSNDLCSPIRHKSISKQETERERVWRRVWSIYCTKVFKYSTETSMSLNYAFKCLSLNRVLASNECFPTLAITVACLCNKFSIWLAAKRERDGDVLHERWK